MGLGKTVQGIVFALLADRLQLFPGLPSLIITARGLLDQWLATWANIVESPAPPWETYTIYGADVDTGEWSPVRKALPFHQKGADGRQLPAAAGSETVVMAPWTHCSSTGKASKYSRDSFADRPWGLLLVDEGHKITRVRSDNIYQPFLNKLLSIGRVGFRVFLTGTPMCAAVDHQLTINRSAGSAHCQRDMVDGSTIPAWVELDGAARKQAQAIAALKDPTMELEHLQAQIEQLLLQTPPPKDLLEQTLTNLYHEGEHVSKLSVTAALAERSFKRLLLPFFQPPRDRATVDLPLPATQNFMLRRFLAFDDLGVTPHAFTVRVPMSEEFANIFNNSVGMLKSRADHQASDEHLKLGHVGEVSHRLVSTHPSLVIDPETYEDTFAIAKEVPAAKIVEGKEHVREIERELRRINQPTTYRPTGLNPDARAIYEKLAGIRADVARWDMAKYVNALTDVLGQQVARRCLLAHLETPMASVLVMLLRNVMAASRNEPLPTPSVTQMMPPARDEPIKILVYCYSHAAVAFVSHILRTNSIKSMHLAADPNRGRTIQAFFADIQCPVLIVTSKDTAGLELQKASVLVFWDIPGSEVTQAQAMGRIARRGQTVDPYIYRIEVEKTYCDHAKVLQRLKKAVTTAIDEGPAKGKPQVSREKIYSENLLQFLDSEAAKGTVSKSTLERFSQKSLDALTKSHYEAWCLRNDDDGSNETASLQQAHIHAQKLVSDSAVRLRQAAEALTAAQKGMEGVPEDKTAGSAWRTAKAALSHAAPEHMQAKQRYNAHLAMEKTAMEKLQSWQQVMLHTKQAEVNPLMYRGKIKM